MVVISIPLPLPPSALSPNCLSHYTRRRGVSTLADDEGGGGASNDLDPAENYRPTWYNAGPVLE